MIKNANEVQLTSDFKDVANHQVRNLRALLVEDTVRFERHLFLQRMENRRVDVRSALGWYSQAQLHYERLNTFGGRRSIVDEEDMPVGAFVLGLVEQLGFSSGGPFELPNVFQLDMDRLNGFRSELQKGIALDVCMMTFVIFAREYFCYQDEAIPMQTMQRLRSTLLSLTEKDSRSTSTPSNTGFCGSSSFFFLFSRHAPELALEMARTACRLVGEDGSHLDADLVEQMSDDLRGYLQVDSLLWQYQEDLVLHFLAQTTLTQTLAYLDLPVLTVAESVNTTTGILPPPAPAPPPHLPSSVRALSEETPTTITRTVQASGIWSLSSSSSEATLVEIARRLAHLASLHWRVFAPLIYLRPVAALDEGERRIEGRGT